MIRVVVPATSANLGVGYDTLGMAVAMCARVTFERADALSITGCPARFRNERNLVYTSFELALRRWGEKPCPVAIDIATEIPVARGLGSSSACIVAGLIGAAGLIGRTIDRDELVSMAAEIEGHPDNAAAAVLGGAVCSFTPTGASVRCVRYDVCDRLRFVTVIPPYEVRTADARTVMPAEVPLETAVWQMGRIAGLTRGLETGDVDLIAAAADDRLHEVHRRPLIADYGAIRKSCLEGGAATMWISGSGSALMAVTDGQDAAASLAAQLRALFPVCDIRVLTCDAAGARLT